MENVYSVQVRKLTSLWSPLETLGLSTLDVSDLYSVKPLTRFREKHRGRVYHLRRVRHFIDYLQNGKDLDPIGIDNDLGFGVELPFPVVWDGNHRLIAYLLTGARTCPATYKGDPRVLSYIQGRRRTPPLSHDDVFSCSDISDIFRSGIA